MTPTQVALIATLLASGGAQSTSAAEQKNKVHPMPMPTAPAHTEGEIPSLGGATGWLNSPPLTREGLRGKVVLVEFWTYTCINWLRTMPYVRAWADRYRDLGLVVIGVHSPEFPFEQDVANVRRAAKDLRVGYPIALDPEFAVWRAFGNQYWPALYLVDAQGRIRHHHFGEGGYEETERVLRQLLEEAGHPPVGRELVKVTGMGIEAAADWASLESPESYLGAARAESFSSPEGVTLGRPKAYSAPPRLDLNGWALSGTWTIKGGSALSSAAGGRLVYRFHARDVNLVMGPATAGGSIRFRVLIDGRPPGAGHGVDVDERGNGTLTAPRLYQLVRQSAPIVDRQLEIEFLDPGAEAYVFTFG